MEDPVAQARSEGVEGFLHTDELRTLMDLAAGKDVLEVGAFMGLSAWGMAQTARTVFSVDTFRAATDGQRQTTDEDRGGNPTTTLDAYLRATQRFSNVSYYVGTSEQAAEDLHGDWDLIFIDAMHTYEDVKADLLRWLPRIRPGGLLAVHDYGHWDYPGVKKAVDEVVGEIPEAQRIHSLAWLKVP